MCWRCELVNMAREMKMPVPDDLYMDQDVGRRRYEELLDLFRGPNGPALMRAYLFKHKEGE